jgi:hypothetical protein
MSPVSSDPKTHARPSRLADLRKNLLRRAQQITGDISSGAASFFSRSCHPSQEATSVVPCDRMGSMPGKLTTIESVSSLTSPTGTDESVESESKAPVTRLRGAAPSVKLPFNTFLLTPHLDQDSSIKINMKDHDPVRQSLSEKPDKELVKRMLDLADKLANRHGRHILVEGYRPVLVRSMDRIVDFDCESGFHVNIAPYQIYPLKGDYPLSVQHSVSSMACSLPSMPWVQPALGHGERAQISGLSWRPGTPQLSGVSSILEE